jgi:hypothetical protein
MAPTTKGQLLYQKRQATARATEALVALELRAQGYHNVSFLGTHHPIADFRVIAQSGQVFLVDAKGNSKQNSWAFPDKLYTEHLYYVLVELWRTPKPVFYILTQAESIQLGIDYQNAHPLTDRNVHRGGFGRKDPYPHKDAWGKLPR